MKQPWNSGPLASEISLGSVGFRNVDLSPTGVNKQAVSPVARRRYPEANPVASTWSPMATIQMPSTFSRRRKTDVRRASRRVSPGRPRSPPRVFVCCL